MQEQENVDRRMVIFTEMTYRLKRNARSIQNSLARGGLHRSLQVAIHGVLIGAATVPLTFAQQPPLKARLSSLLASNAQIETVAVELTPTGFIPTEVKVTSRSFFLKVRSSFLRSVPLEGTSNTARKVVLRLEAGGRKKQEAVRFTLAPGQYSLAVADNPEWKLTITVEPVR